MEKFCRSFAISWDGIEIAARHMSGDSDVDAHGEPLDRIEIEVIEPAGAWLPIGFAGRGAYSVSRARIARYGDASGYITAWLDHEAGRSA
jgi:hypothetical protein